MTRKTPCASAKKAHSRDRIRQYASREATRVAVIEIGSRAIRLLVADLSLGSLSPVLTRVADADLLDSAGRGNGSTAGRLRSVYSTVLHFREQAMALNPSRLAIFGTEALRIAAADDFRRSPLYPLVEVLDERTEARCSFSAALMELGTRWNDHDRVLVIDQGAGSMELAIGLAGDGSEINDYASLEFGGTVMLQRLRGHKLNLKSFSADVAEQFRTCRLPKGPIEHVIIQGTVATKCAWLTIRENRDDRYDARRVHGCSVGARVLEDIIATVAKFTPAQWASFRAFVNPHEPTSDGFDRVVAGAVPLLEVLKRLGKRDFVVSAHGTRHGFAWQLAFGAKQQHPA